MTKEFDRNHMGLVHGMGKSVNILILTERLSNPKQR
jgi:hypothetical protein